MSSSPIIHHPSSIIRLLFRRRISSHQPSVTANSPSEKRFLVLHLEAQPVLSGRDILSLSV